jgi:1-acyl-sn-glycerol-3-phosphate acyltransferase
MRRRPLTHRLLYRGLQALFRIVGVLMFRVRHFGVHNIPAEGGVLVVANHQSHLDPPLVGIGCWRAMNYLARETLFRFGPFGWLIRAVDAIPIDREGVGLSGIKESIRRLKAGEIVVMFPEGTRSPDGEIGPFRPGFTALATRSKAAILPVAIEGAYAAWPRRRWLPRPGRVLVHYGRPLLPDEIAGRGDEELAAEIRRRVVELQEGLRRRLPNGSRRRSSR